MCRSVANQTRCAQTVVCNSIDRANDFCNAGFPDLERLESILEIHRINKE